VGQFVTHYPWSGSGVYLPQYKPLRHLIRMKTSLFLSTRLLALVAIAGLFHTQLAFPAGCDLPMFAGARLFAAATTRSQFMATADFNHDGFLDVVTSDGNNTVSVLLGNGDGTFQPAVNYAVPQPKNMAVADFNGDGKLDLAIWSSFSIAFSRQSSFRIDCYWPSNC